jgi:hypothetical protein
MGSNRTKAAHVADLERRLAASEAARIDAERRLTADTPTQKRLAVARRLMPASTAAKARARSSMESGLLIPKLNICSGWTESRRRPGNPLASHDAREPLW